MDEEGGEDEMSESVTETESTYDGVEQQRAVEQTVTRLYQAFEQNAPE